MNSEIRPRIVQPLAVPEIVTLPAEIDITNARQVGRELAGALQQPDSVVIADMSLTEFCDSSGVRALLIASDMAAAHGSELRLAVRSEPVLRVFRILGVEVVLNLYPSMDQALAEPRHRS